MYIGNSRTKTKLIQWLNNYFHSKTNKVPDFVILYGNHGNGKTSLVYYLAKKFNVDVLKITCDDTETKDKANKCLQSINLCKLDGHGTKKILLIDDIEDFKNKIYINKILNICNYPIILTARDYPMDDKISKGLKLPIYKPFIYELIKILKAQELSKNFTERQLEYISIHSPSVRSAINSLYTGLINKSYQPNTSLKTKKDQLLQRALQQDIDMRLLHRLIKGMNCYTKEGQKVFNRFCLYDADIKIKYKEKINKYKVNNMLEPIENIKWIKFDYKKSQKKKKPKVEQKPVSTHQSIENWF